MDFEAIKELLFNYLRRLDQDEMQALMSYLSLLVQEFNSDHFKFKVRLESEINKLKPKSLSGTIVRFEAISISSSDNGSNTSTLSIDDDDSSDSNNVELVEEDEMVSKLSNECEEMRLSPRHVKAKKENNKFGCNLINCSKLFKHKNSMMTQSLNLSQRVFLLKQYDKNIYPKPEELKQMARVVNLTPLRVFCWFLNRRLRNRANLRQKLSKLRIQNRRNKIKRV